MSHWTDALVSLYACGDAVAWCRTHPDLATAWARCVRGDWMLWLAGRLSGSSPGRTPERLRLVACARECAREAWPYVKDEDTATAITLCDHILGEWLEDRADMEDLRAAYAAAYSAAYSADADAAAASSAAYSAYSAAYSADAAASSAASSAAYSAAYSADAADAARKCVLRRCADIARRHYPDAPVVVPRSSPQPEEEQAIVAEVERETVAQAERRAHP